MATEKLNISGWDNGWPTGFVTNVDESIANADGSTVSTNIVNDAVVFDLTNPVVVDDMDQVTLVSIDIRCRVSSTFNAPNLDVELLIGGVSQGTANLAAPTTTMTTHTFIADAGWWQDWTQAQLNSAQVRLTTRGGLSTTFYLDCIDVVITYTAIDPIFKPVQDRHIYLNGKVPQIDISSDSPFERPAQAVRNLVGKVPIVNRSVSPAAASLTTTGKISYINSQQLRLEPNGWNGTAQGWSGFVTNVDENVDTPDGSVVSTTDTNPVTFDFSNVPTNVISNESTVLSVTVRIRHRGVSLGGIPGEPALDFYSFSATLLINGISRGGVSRFDVADSAYTTSELTSSTWNQDWTVAQLNSLQVRVSPDPLDSRFDLDAIDVIVEHVPQSPFLLPIAKASLSLAGKTPVKTVNFIRSPARLAASLSGKLPTLFRQLYEKPPYAIRRLNGKAVTLLRNSIRSPARYAATLAAKTALRISNFLPQAAEGDLTLSGKTPTFEHTQDHVARPLRGRLYLFKGNVLPQDSGGTNTYIGPDRLRVYLEPQPISGVSVSDNPLLSPPTLAATLTGTVAGLAQTATPAQRALVLSGKDISFTVGLRFSPSVYTLTVDGKLPNIDELTGLLQITGYPPVMSEVSKPAAAALALTPHDLDTLRNRLRLPGRCPLVFSGKEGPSLRFSTVLTPGQPGLISLTVDYGIEFIGTPYDEVQY